MYICFLYSHLFCVIFFIENICDERKYCVWNKRTQNDIWKIPGFLGYVIFCYNISIWWFAINSIVNSIIDNINTNEHHQFDQDTKNIEFAGSNSNTRKFSLKCFCEYNNLNYNNVRVEFNQFEKYFKSLNNDKVENILCKQVSLSMQFRKEVEDDVDGDSNDQGTEEHLH